MTIDKSVPPHARRSTPDQRPYGIAVGGSSARAEIDPMKHLIRDYAPGFLRTRGDRPWIADGWIPPAWVPPHARRSTPDPRLARRPAAGSSARAEIDLLRLMRE